MTLSESIGSCLSGYVKFEGRASRSEYWFYFLFSVVVGVISIVIDNVAGTTFSPETAFGWFYAGFLVLNFLPSISVSIRRLHDTDRSGWWFWILLVPLVGGLCLLVWHCFKGTIGDNRFGENPLSKSAPPTPSLLNSQGEPSIRTSSGDVADQLEKLAALHASGALTDQEFNKLKSKAIGI